MQIESTSLKVSIHLTPDLSPQEEEEGRLKTKKMGTIPKSISRIILLGVITFVHSHAVGLEAYPKVRREEEVLDDYQGTKVTHEIYMNRETMKNVPTIYRISLSPLSSPFLPLLLC